MRPLRDGQEVQSRASLVRSQFLNWDGPLAAVGLETIDLDVESLPVKAESKQRARNFELVNVFSYEYPKFAIPLDRQIRDDLHDALEMLASVHSDPSLLDRSNPLKRRRKESGGVKGAGRSSNYDLNRAIELRAMDVVAQVFEEREYSTEDVSSENRGYDIHCTRGDDTRHVEVKGTRRAGTEVNISPNEVDYARKSEHALLAVVYGIEVTNIDGQHVATGGTLKELYPWSPLDEDLRPTGYQYQVP